MMHKLFSFGLLLLGAKAGIVESLEGYCPDGIDYWSEVDSGEWYWGAEWDEFLANDTDIFGNVGSDEEIYPAGFRIHTLAQYSEPPICMVVPESHDKKVEILMESNLENANLCIRDASYNSVGTNDVGNLANCGSGKIYACFTAATSQTTNEDFGFYVSCAEGCEDMEVDVWIRVRVSDKSWDQGKTTTSSDLEHWCEQERGTTVDSDDATPHLYYTYPSDLIPDEPSEYPFHITQLFGQSAGSHTRPRVWIILVLAFVGLAALFC